MNKKQQSCTDENCMRLDTVDFKENFKIDAIDPF